MEINDGIMINDGSSVTVEFPKTASYVLGTRMSPRSFMKVGPIYGSDVTPKVNHSKLTDNIVSSSQRPHCCLRFQPKVLHIMTDLIYQDTRNAFANRFIHNDCRIIDSIVITNDMRRNHFIYKLNEGEGRYFKLKQSKHILDRFKIVIVDENYQDCTFARRCYVSFSLSMRPVTFDF